MTDRSKITEVYSKVALFINACGMEVTPKRMERVLQELGFLLQAKLMEIFSEIPPQKYNEMMMCVSSAPVVAAAQPAAAQVAAAQVAPEEEAKKEEPMEDEEIDFGDMFG